MKISTKWTSNAHGASQIVARGIGGKQKTTNVDLALSNSANHGIAAANLIIHVQRTSPELQYGDNIVSSVVRSLDAGYGEHDMSDDGQRHTFDV